MTGLALMNVCSNDTEASTEEINTFAKKDKVDDTYAYGLANYLYNIYVAIFHLQLFLAKPGTVKT